jgi:transcription initiation factor TFIIIB Brf1 subunit/transcription initiation factor TFIIB
MLCPKCGYLMDLIDDRSGAWWVCDDCGTELPDLGN